MKKELRYNDEITMAEYQIAVCDEIDIEATVWDSQNGLDDFDRRTLASDRAVLREIEKLKLSGKYKARRRQLSAKLEPSLIEHRRFIKTIQNLDFGPLENFMDGLNSSDADQKARFQRLYNEAGLGGKMPCECVHILNCLEKGKKHKGRPGVSPPWRNVVASLDAMRFAVAAGLTIPQAAQSVANGEGDAMAESRAHRYEKLFRQRQAIRE